MLHCRSDYNRIQDPANLIGKDEPVFLLRGQDITAPHIVRLWASAQRQNPKVDPMLIFSVESFALIMEAWQCENITKWADLPENARTWSPGILFTEVTADTRPPNGHEVIGYHPTWIHPDFNPEGTRICFINDENEWHSAGWVDYQDTYVSLYTADGNEKEPNTIYELENTAPSHYFKIPKSPAPIVK